ncbi:hypothetical protein BU25DRAFT_491905 [Macroventuria anomochaeta]|uniref:Uncharacterized protein n=1 Tax=Macroventuria anomochaeta TaxID=301207 RepID=A0ACB6S023_9PLEO|nr:uncharacterized protein BU25DRAFT_491905 [Macroventuria anomochaeta]KAF2626544.1 hypothetical protein BU25DRAFT_491905 [Macroventuria anomochaeta]
MTTNSEGHPSTTQNPDTALQALPAPLSSPRVSIVDHYNIPEDQEESLTTLQPTAVTSPGAPPTTVPNGHNHQGDVITQIDDPLHIPAAGGGLTDTPPVSYAEQSGFPPAEPRQYNIFRRSIAWFKSHLDPELVTEIRMRACIASYHHNEKPLFDEEMTSICCNDAIVTLQSGRELASFGIWVKHGVAKILFRGDQLLKRLCKLESLPLLRWLRTADLQAMLRNSDISLYSSSRIDKIVSILVPIIFFWLLILPLIAIYRLNHPHTSSSTVKSIGVLAAFAVIFSGTLSVVTMT